MAFNYCKFNILRRLMSTNINSKLVSTVIELISKKS